MDCLIYAWLAQFLQLQLCRAIFKSLIATFVINMVLHLYIQMYTFMHKLDALLYLYVLIINAVFISNIVCYNNVY